MVKPCLASLSTHESPFLKRCVIMKLINFEMSKQINHLILIRQGIKDKLEISFTTIKEFVSNQTLFQFLSHASFMAIIGSVNSLRKSFVGPINKEKLHKYSILSFLKILSQAPRVRVPTTIPSMLV